MSSPRFSLLLPTSNRLSLLRQAVASIRDQSFGDFEIVISDNASEEDVGQYVRELNDPRIIYSRSSERLDVTANWNRALALSSGELVLMLGDDDGLARGYLARLDRLARETDAEAIYTGAFLLTYPGVSPSLPAGELRPYGYARFMGQGPELRALPYDERRRHVLTMLSGRVSFGFNMQFILVTRQLLQRVSTYGEFYQSLFPDYYAMVACFLEARQLLSLRRDCVFIGVSPKSYGFYHQRQRETEGATFLHTEATKRDRQDVLPGSHIVTGWQSAAETIVARLGARHALKLSPTAFRMRQIAHNVGLFHAGRKEQISPDFRKRLLDSEKILWSILTAPIVGRRLSRRFQHRVRLIPFDWSPPPLATAVESLDQARALPATFVE
jgi:hypothetical protein